jgi:hypothetical protein
MWGRSLHNNKTKKTVAFFHFIIPYFEVNSINCILLEGAKYKISVQEERLQRFTFFNPFHFTKNAFAYPQKSTHGKSSAYICA